MTTEVNFFTQPVIVSQAKVMVFIDGENFAMCYGRMLGTNSPASHVNYEKDVYVWTEKLNYICSHVNVIRKHYYTSVVGDSVRIENITDQLKEAGIEAPRVYKKTKKKGSKQVDISLATEMLIHAHRKNYDVAVLIAGDKDYIPLIEAVQAEGCRAFLWFVDNGLSKDLRRKADRYNDLGHLLDVKK